MPNLFATNFYSVTQGDLYPWTYNGTNTFASLSAVIYINAIVNSITAVNGSSSGFTVTYSGSQTIITMNPYALPNVTTGNAPVPAYTIEYVAGSVTITTTMYVKFVFQYNPALVTEGCSESYTYHSVAVPVEF